MSDKVDSPKVDENTTPVVTDSEKSDDEKYEDVQETIVNEKSNIVVEKRGVKKDTELTDEEKKMLESFVVKNLDTNEVTTLLEVVQTAKNPIYTQLIGKVKDYEFPQEEKKIEKKDSKRNVWDLFRKKDGSPLKPEKKYKYKANNKTIRQFDHITAAQKITGHAGAIWTMKFNKSGTHLATGGQDGYVIIWKVNLKKKDIKEGEGPWIDPEPVQKYLGGQSGDVLDLAWSQSDFLLSSTMDKKVRAWHLSRKECLGVFAHSEIVTGVQFHPTNETLFITGSFDEKLRLFNLRERELIHFVDTKLMITAVGFNGDGKIAMAGTYDGKCLFYSMDETEGFKKITLLDVRSRRGKNKARKVTGITLLKEKDQILVSTNDSRARLYSLHDYSLNCKYVGMSNHESQISASFSPNGEFIISGSEDFSVYIWNVNNDYFPNQKIFSNYKKDKNVSYETFSDHQSIVTNAIFAPFDYWSRVGREKPEGANNGYVILTGDFKGEIQVFETQ
jgi:WD40 repeat protein